MSLWTRTVMLVALIVLSLALGLGLDRAMTSDPTDIDRLVSARNFRRAIAYRAVDYQGGSVARSNNGDRFQPIENAVEESHPGAKISHKRSLRAMEYHEANLAAAEIEQKIEEAINGEEGLTALKNKIAGFNRERREVMSRFNEVENRVRLFAMTLDGYSYMIQTFQQRLINLDYEIHLAIIERNALLAEQAQVVADAANLIGDRSTVEDNNYSVSKQVSGTSMKIKEYEQRDPRLRGKADRLGNPWVKGVVERADKDSRSGRVFISIGWQDGVQLGQVLSVHRGGQFIARMRVESVLRNSAQGRVLEEYRGRTPARVGDKVRGAINFGEALRND